MDNEYVNNIIAIRGDLGKKWITDLPKLIKHYEKLWEITVLSPFPLSYNFVAPGKTTQGHDVVLKILLPHATEISYEAKALAFYDGLGAIKLLKEDSVNNALLLEKAIPGVRLEKEKKENQLSAFVHVANKLHKAVPDSIITSFPTLLAWANDFAVYRKAYTLNTGPIPKQLFQEAENIFTQYPKDKKQKFLLHGDLHDQNILFSARGWIAIDPKGIIGEREFEAGVFFRTFSEQLLQHTDYKKIMVKNISLCAEMLGVEKRRIIDWAFAGAVNGLVWFLEDEKRFKDIYLKNAVALHSLINSFSK